MIVFGGVGDLSYQKIYPALYDIAEKGLLPDEKYAIVATGRRYTQKEFHSFFQHSLTSDNRHHRHSISSETFKRLIRHIHFFGGDYEDPRFYNKLSSYLLELIKKGLPCGNRLFYIGVPQNLYGTVFINMKNSNLDKSPCGWTRVVLEKPIGHDLPSAKIVDKLVTSAFSEEQIFRLDHYLGKETLENVLTFRFKNAIFEPLLNGTYLDHIQITAVEDFDIAKRGKFYDATGALRDVGQNHLLQMVTIATMERPKDESDEALINERIKLINSLRAKPSDLVLSQYAQGKVHDLKAIAYRQEENVDPRSETDTFFALKLMIDNSRFGGIPVYIRTGKQMATWATEINYVFKGKTPNDNVLTIRLQPNEGIAVKLLTKKPGYDLSLEPTYMQFCYKHYFPNQTFDAYEKLLQDVFAGKRTFFNTSTEVEALWKFIDPLSKKRPKTTFYAAGSWGPKEAFHLIEKDGRQWLEPYMAFCQI